MQLNSMHIIQKTLYVSLFPRKVQYRVQRYYHSQFSNTNKSPQTLEAKTYEHKISNVSCSIKYRGWTVPLQFDMH